MAMDSPYDDGTLLPPDCSIRKSLDITPICGSPRLIAAYRVLLRLPVPRHSPCALLRLTKLCFKSVLSAKKIIVVVFTRFVLKQSKNLTFTSSHFPLFNFQGARMSVDN